MRLYIGSSPPEPDGPASIAVLAVGDGGTPRPAAGAALARSPSFLVAHPALPVLYAAETVEDGAVRSFAVAPDGSLSPLGRQPSGGSDPIHLAVAADGRHLLVANWGDGAVAVLPLAADGVPGPPSHVVDGGGSRYAHHVSLDGDDVTAVHMGTNALIGYRLERGGRLRRTWSAAARARAGPRHLVRHPSGRRFVADELSSTLSTWVPDPSSGGLRLAHGVPATIEPPAGPNHLSEIAASPDGRFVYVASRGNDSITTFDVAGERPVAVDETPTGGVFPRHFALVGDRIYVANERSHTVTVLALDGGVPRPTGHSLATPSPTCVLPWP